MLPLVWAQTKATGRGRPNGAAAIEAYNVARRAHKERLAALAAAGVEDGAFYAEAGADLPMDMIPATGALEPVAGKRAVRQHVELVKLVERAGRRPPVYMSDGPRTRTRGAALGEGALEYDAR